MNLNRTVWTLIPFANEGNNTGRTECRQLAGNLQKVGSLMDY